MDSLTFYPPSSSGDALLAPIDAPAPPPSAPVPPPAGPEPKPAEAEAPGDEKAEAAQAAAKPGKRKRRRPKAVKASASWVVSLAVHVAVLAVLGLATFSSEVKKAVANINSALVATPGAGEELLHVLADPSAQRSTQAVGSEGAPAVGGGEGGGSGSFGGIGTGPPSATPKVSGVGRGVGKGEGLPGVKMVANVSGLNLVPSASRLGVDLGGGGMIGGDVTYEAKDVGVALDQIAREILRHLGQHKLTVVWLFDESESMKDDQRAIREKFDRVASELKANVDQERRRSSALNHAIVGFGQDLHFELEKPTADIDRIGEAIDRLKVDSSGTENTMHALAAVVGRYSGLINKDRRLLIVLVTDESGDDGDFVEEAHQALKSREAPLYVIGRQALFGLPYAHLLYVDPVTKEHFYPAIRRGPESADIENLQWDGLRGRRDEQPSGFAPYELARLSKDSGGIYFLLPSEEGMRVHKREQLYSMKTLKEYLPDYGPRGEYLARRNGSDLRRTLHDIILTIKGTSYRDAFPIDPAEFAPAAAEAIPVTTARLDVLLNMQRRLEGLGPARDREPDKRWQAHYDLMLAQVVAYQIKAYEYRACLEEILRTKPKAKNTPGEKLHVWWGLDHSTKPKADKEQTAKKYAEAARLFNLVLDRHPNTPWSDLAKDEMHRGFSVGWGEHTHVPYTGPSRAKFVPKF